MSLTMYQASIPMFTHTLNNLSSILDKAEVFAKNKKIDPAVLIQARLAPDMFPLVRQIQIATDTVKGCAARLAGVEVPSFSDTENSFSELHTRISKTLEFIQSIQAKQLDGSEERSISLKVGPEQLNFIGHQYLFYFVIPNFYFHVSMAYAILRHNGLDIGKRDYLGRAQ